MNNIEALKIIGVLNGAYQSNKLDAQGVEVYSRMMLDLDHDACRQAVLRLVSTKTFFPTIAEIRAATADIQLGPLPSGEQAYGQCINAIHRFGRSYGSSDPVPEFRDALMMPALKATWGSWNEACNSEDGSVADRARFIAAYQQLATAQRADYVSGATALPAASTGPAFWLPKGKP